MVKTQIAMIVVIKIDISFIITTIAVMMIIVHVISTAIAIVMVFEITPTALIVEYWWC